jgi:multimeric flavodoxin WrbA
MNILAFFDKDSTSLLSDDLKTSLIDLISHYANHFSIVEVGRDDVYPCAGCLICFTKNNGVCVKKDLMSEINGRINNYDTIFYIGPIVFGQFSSPIKNVTDKGQIIHISRLGKIPLFFAVGYGTDVTADEKETFIDILKKHRGKANIVHPLLKERLEVFATTNLEENAAVINSINDLIKNGN